eukprot:523669-Rhodomonas_salina.1
MLAGWCAYDGWRVPTTVGALATVGGLTPVGAREQAHKALESYWDSMAGNTPAVKSPVDDEQYYRNKAKG